MITMISKTIRDAICCPKCKGKLLEEKCKSQNSLSFLCNNYGMKYQTL